MATRDELLLDAAIEVLGTGGMRRLTHRAVDAAAGLPMGSTSNRFRTRDLLLTGVLGRILERETAAWNGVATRVPITSLDALARALGQLVEEQLAGDPHLAQARRAIFVEAANHPALRDAVQQGRRELGSWMTPLLAEFGVPDPEHAVQHLLALMEGLIGNQLASDSASFDAVTPLAALLRGLLSEA